MKVSERTENNGIGPPAAGAGADAAADPANAQLAASSSTTASPILVFLNSASGGKMGPKVLDKIRVLIPESQ